MHYCEKTQSFHSREYRDALTLGHGLPTPMNYPTEDENGYPLVTEFGFSTYRDTQRISIQEMPERSPAGQLPRPIDIILDDDLVDKTKPGDRIAIVGVYRTVGGGHGGTSGNFKTLLLGNHVHLLNKDISVLNYTDDDISNFKNLPRKYKKSILDLLAQSVAPSIYGHDYIKKAVVLQLLGGAEKNLANGTHIRGYVTTFYFCLTH